MHYRTLSYEIPNSCLITCGFKTEYPFFSSRADRQKAVEAIFANSFVTVHLQEYAKNEQQDYVLESYKKKISTLQEVNDILEKLEHDQPTWRLNSKESENLELVTGILNTIKTGRRGCKLDTFPDLTQSVKSSMNQAKAQIASKICTIS